MDKITVALMSEAHTEKLFEFEWENREFFARMGLDRDESYYDRESFDGIMQALIHEQSCGTYASYVVINADGKIVGRVSFSDIVRGPFQKAELGYRIAQAHQGRGYATAAVKLAIEDFISRHKLHRLEAGTNVDNIGSQIVLVKNGFEFCGRQRSSFFQGGKWHDGLMFERVFDE